MQNRRQALYTPTKNLTMKYSFNNTNHEDTSVVFSSKHIHAQLYAACKDFKKKRAEATMRNGKPAYSTSISGINFSTAAISILYADTPPEEGYIGDVLSASFAVFAFNPNRLITCSNLYNNDTSYFQDTVRSQNEALRNFDFNERLSDRISTFSSISKYYDYNHNNTVTSIPELNERIANANFHRKFHHTEQGEMEVLSSPLGIECLMENILAFDVQYVMGLVLDIYTDLPMCNNCNACLLGMQCSHQRGFLDDFTASLKENRIYARDNGNFMLSIRVSTSNNEEPFNLAPNNVINYNPDKKRVIYQASNTQMNVNQVIRKEGYSLATYPGTIFTSSKVSAEKLNPEIGLSDEIAFPQLIR